MIKKYEIKAFVEANERTTKPITKFGGQPVWIGEPQWPVSAGWDDRLMMFVGQIAIEKGMLGNQEGFVAYIFVTHPEDHADTFFDPDVTEWNGGENAVIIQPSGINHGEFQAVERGPTLFDAHDVSKEYLPMIEASFDPAFIPDEEYRKLDDAQQKKYFDTIDTNKIGGTPNFFRGDAGLEEGWQLLLQLKCNFLPFVLRLGAMPVMFVLISEDFKRGGLLIQD